MEEGDEVEAGEIVALIDSKDQEARVRKASSAVNSATASLTFKESAYSRSQELFNKGLISNEEFQATKGEAV